MKKFILFFTALFLTASLEAVVINKISVNGVKRIDSEAIIAELNIKKGKNISEEQLNENLKKLYALDLFETINFNVKGNNLIIDIKENPTINKVEFSGNKEIDTETLTSEVNIRPRAVYSEFVVNDAMNRMLELYKRSGFYRVEIKSEKNDKDQNRVDLTFKIKENSKTFIDKIDFVGNKSFSNNALKQILMSREDTWWRFFSSVTTYDPDRVLYDQELLNQFYLNNGYIDFKVVDVISDLNLDRSGYYTKYIIDEGKRYKIGKIEIENSLKEVDTKKLYKHLEFAKNDYYNASEIDISVRKMQDAIADLGYAFVRIIPIPNSNKASSVVDMTFRIMPTKKMYVNRMDVIGNVRTMDYVIEREFKVKEGDAFNLSEIKKTESKLMNTRYFKKAKVITKGVEGDPDKLNLLTEIEEQSTGEVNFGFGWSSYNGAFLEAGIKESNFMGKGQTLGLTGQYSNKQSRAVVSFTEPFFLDSNISAGADVDYSYYRYKRDYGYDMERFGVGVRFGWNYFDNLRQFIRISNRNDNVTNVTGTPPEYAQKEEGPSTIRLIEQNITFSDIKTDWVNLTRSGYLFSLGINYAGMGGDESFIQPEFRALLFQNFFDNEWQISTSVNAGYIDPLKDEYIKKSYRYNLGGETLRGFRVAGIGARMKAPYESYSLGAYSQVYGNVQMNFPVGLPKEYKISGFVFYDYGWLGKPADFDPVIMDYSSMVRSSAGLGVKWFTPMGEINISWAKPLTYEKYDRLERFLLSFGAQF